MLLIAIAFIFHFAFLSDAQEALNQEVDELIQNADVLRGIMYMEKDAENYYKLVEQDKLASKDDIELVINEIQNIIDHVDYLINAMPDELQIKIDANEYATRIHVYKAFVHVYKAFVLLNMGSLTEAFLEIEGAKNIHPLIAQGMFVYKGKNRSLSDIERIFESNILKHTGKANILIENLGDTIIWTEESVTLKRKSEDKRDQENNKDNVKNIDTIIDYGKKTLVTALNGGIHSRMLILPCGSYDLVSKSDDFWPQNFEVSENKKIDVLLDSTDNYFTLSLMIDGKTNNDKFEVKFQGKVLDSFSRVQFGRYSIINKTFPFEKIDLLLKPQYKKPEKIHFVRTGAHHTFDDDDGYERVEVENHRIHEYLITKRTLSQRPVFILFLIIAAFSTVSTLMIR